MDYLSENDELLQLERQLQQEGFFVAGIDEAGRGPLAGPVVAAAVMLPQGIPIPRVADSKQLSDKERRELCSALRELPGIRFGIAEVDAKTIDRVNILNATHLAMRRALDQVKGTTFALIDGNPVKGMPIENRSVIKGDAKCACIAAASILAKVRRDNRMLEFDKRYPQYGFAAHKGYGTAQHLAALKQYGATEIHRRSFAPVRAVLDAPVFEQKELFS